MVERERVREREIASERVRERERERERERVRERGRSPPAFDLAMPPLRRTKHDFFPRYPTIPRCSLTLPAPRPSHRRLPFIFCSPGSPDKTAPVRYTSCLANGIKQ